MKTNNKKGGENTSFSKEHRLSRSKSRSKPSRSKLNSYKEGLNPEQLFFVTKLEDYYSKNLGHRIEIQNKEIILTLVKMKTQIDIKEGILDNTINEEKYHTLFDIPEEQHESIPKNKKNIRITTIQESIGQDGKKKTRIFYPNGKVYDIKDNIFSRNLPSIMTRKRIAGSKTKNEVPKKTKTQKKRISNV
jgi:hypothetical protein